LGDNAYQGFEVDDFLPSFSFPTTSFFPEWVLSSRIMFKDDDFAIFSASLEAINSCPNFLHFASTDAQMARKQLTECHLTERHLKQIDDRSNLD
jgi:hypothetical protein